MKPQFIAACILLVALAGGIIAVSSLNKSNAEPPKPKLAPFGNAKTVTETTPEVALEDVVDEAAIALANDALDAELTDEERKIRAAEAEADDLPRVKMETSKGTMIIELFENQAPNHTANFISLAEKGFYDGIGFHRVLEGFMAQGGCPIGDGTGNPGYRIRAEFNRPDHREHFTGTLSMARSNNPDSAGSQFFLCFNRARTAGLDGKYTAFGRVIQGLEVLPKIQRRDPSRPSSRDIIPDKMIKVTVLRKRDHEYKPETLPPLER
jgi:cyclophilin family peptidyl-prolyl cis-trans isomerase